jgi:homoserine dehydrogenase
MADGGATYADALRDAQALGFAEADATLDVSGQDAAQKLCLLARLAFQARLETRQVAVEGIESLRPVDFDVAKEFGYALKLLALARRGPDGLDVRVHPALIPAAAPLADVRGGFNAVLLQSAALGTSMYSGLGAGALPMGSAVVSDIIDVARNILAGVSGRLPMLCEPYLQEVAVRPADERVGRAYLRFTVADAPGVLGRIATALGERGVSIASLVQRQPLATEPSATIAAFTHRARDADVRAAVAAIDALESAAAPTRWIRIEDEPPLGA